MPIYGQLVGTSDAKAILGEALCPRNILELLEQCFCHVELPHEGTRRYPKVYLDAMRRKRASLTAAAVLKFNSSERGQRALTVAYGRWLARVELVAVESKSDRPGWLLPREAAGLMGVTPQTIHNWVKSGLIDFDPGHEHERASFYLPQTIMGTVKWVHPV